MSEVKREIRNKFAKKWDKDQASVKEMYDEIINNPNTVYGNYGRTTLIENTNDKISINTKIICERKNELDAKPFKSIKEPLELCKIRKVARRAIRRDISKFDEGRAREIMELYG